MEDQKRVKLLFSNIVPNQMQVFNREKKRALMESRDAFTAQAEAMADRMRREASAALLEVTHYMK